VRGRSFQEEAEQKSVSAWLERWRCASARHLAALYQPKHHRRGADRFALRQAQRILNLIARDGHAQLVTLRSNVNHKVFRTASAEAVAARDWVSVDLAAALAAQGAVAHRGLDAAVAVRRHLIDQSPPEVQKLLRADPRTPRDDRFQPAVAVLKGEPILLWVDDGRDIGSQARELPVWTDGQAALKVIVRTTDDGSYRGDGERPVAGPRMKEMVSALKGAAGARLVGFWDGGWWLANRGLTSSAPQ
jgi:hypothetical protein